MEMEMEVFGWCGFREVSLFEFTLFYFALVRYSMRGGMMDGMRGGLGIFV